MRFGPSGETIFWGALASSWGAGKCFCSFLKFFGILAEKLMGRKCRWEKSGPEKAQNGGRITPSEPGVLCDWRSQVWLGWRSDWLDGADRSDKKDGAWCEGRDGDSTLEGVPGKGRPLVLAVADSSFSLGAE